MISVVTTFSQEGAKEYGARFLHSFMQFWPRSVRLIAYVDKPFPIITGPEYRDIDTVDMRSTFLWQHSASDLKRGKVETGVWKSKDIRDGYCFKTDAVKFCHKVFSVADAAARKESEILIWLDADTFTDKRVTPDFIGDLIDHHDVAYLGRENAHSECGFLAFRLPQALPLIMEWAQIYITGEIFNYPEWHDSYLFDIARRKHQRLRYHNLSAHVRRGDVGGGHVWHRTPLGTVMDHMKGDRKHTGFSPERRPT